MLPKYIENLCKNNLKKYPAPYQYVLYQNKHIPQGKLALETKTEQIKKFVLLHNGEFEILSKEPFISSDRLEIIVYFNCDVVTAKAMDAIIK